MTALQIIFYVFSAIAIFSGLLVIISNNPVRSAFFLIMTFFAMAGIWIILHAEFLALILVVVYVGAVMTLFLFVVMMLRIQPVSLRQGFVRYLPLAALIALLVTGLTVLVVDPNRFGLMQVPHPLPESSSYNNVARLGLSLYTDYVYPFEIAAVLLLTAIVAAISLTHRKPVTRKSQNVAQQIAVRSQDRVRILNIPSEKKIKPTGLRQ